MKLRYRLAGHQDDAALRRLLASVPMPGAITVAFEREPDYFAAMRMSGREWQVLVAEDAGTGELAGVFCRSIQDRFVNGAPARVAYWGNLRIARAYQRSVFLSRAFEFGEGVYGNDPVDGNVAVIADENPLARKIFTERRRRRFPPLEPVCRILTFAVTLGRRWDRRHVRARTTASAGFDLVCGSDVGLSKIVEFLRGRGASRQLFPVYDEAYFVECGYGPEGFIVALRNGSIAGVAGLWDQSGCKQTVVRSYHGMLRLARPYYNLLAPLGGYPRLPGAGEHIRSAYLSFIAMEEGAPEAFAAILDEACRRACARGFAYLMLGLSETDPLAAIPRGLPHIPYTATLFTIELPADGTIARPGERSFRDRLDGRIPYLEIATL
jgi:hypothetical protein